MECPSTSQGCPAGLPSAEQDITCPTFSASHAAADPLDDLGQVLGSVSLVSAPCRGDGAVKLRDEANAGAYRGASLPLNIIVSLPRL